MTPKQAAELTQNMYEVEYVLPDSKDRQRQRLRMSSEQELLRRVVHN